MLSGHSLGVSSIATSLLLDPEYRHPQHFRFHSPEIAYIPVDSMVSVAVVHYGPLRELLGSVNEVCPGAAGAVSISLGESNKR